MTTTRRTIRIDDDTWRSWHEAAQAQGVTRSVFIRDAVNARLGTGVVRLAADLVEPGAIAKAVRVRVASSSERSIDPTSGMCEHRVPAGSHCSRCQDKETP